MPAPFLEWGMLSFSHSPGSSFHLPLNPNGSLSCSQSPPVFLPRIISLQSLPSLSPNMMALVQRKKRISLKLWSAFVYLATYMSLPLQHRDADELYRCQSSSGNAVSQPQFQQEASWRKGYWPAATHRDQMLEPCGLWYCLNVET